MRMIRFLLYSVLIEICICAPILISILRYSIPVYCVEEYIPTRDSARCYLHQVDSKVIPELREQLANISDQESARGGVQRLMQLGNACIGMYSRSAVYQEIQSESDFLDKVFQLVQQDVAHSESAAEYADVLSNYKRLEEAHFYGDSILETTLHSYFFGNVGGDVIPLWLPTGMLRYNLSTRHLPVSKKSIAELFSQLYDNCPTAQDPRGNNLSLLFLDYCEHAHIITRGDFQLLAPSRPIIRGRNAVFIDCLCSKYCFNCGTPVSPCVAPMAEMHSSAFYSLSKEQAKQLKEFIGEVHDPRYKETSLVFALSPPFLSKYLILHYKDGSQNPCSMIFSNDFPSKAPSSGKR